MHQVEHADQVHVDGVGERLRGQTRGQWCDTGVGHHDVETAELRDTLIDCAGQRLAVTDVGDGGERPLTFLFDEPGGFIEVLGPGQRVFVGVDVLAQVHRDNVGALRGQHPRVRTPLTTPGAADERYLVRHPSHSWSFPRYRSIPFWR